MQNVVEGTVVIGEATYEFATLLKVSKSGPNVIIKSNEINDGTEQFPEQHRVKINSSTPFNDNGSIVFFKQNGKYTIILGSETYKAMKLKDSNLNEFHGYLVSTVALKKAKIA